MWQFAARIRGDLRRGFGWMRVVRVEPAASVVLAAGTSPRRSGSGRPRPDRSRVGLDVAVADATGGARSAGLRTGWCSRLEHHVAPALGPADVTGTSLVEVVRGLIDP